MYSFDVLIIAGDIVHNLRSALDHLAYCGYLSFAVFRPKKHVKPLTT